MVVEVTQSFICFLFTAQSRLRPADNSAQGAQCESIAVSGVV